MDYTHIPVLFRETIDSLRIDPDGTYVDCTGGLGGHSGAIAERLSERGRLVVIDRDPDAAAYLKEKFAAFPNVTVVNDNFRFIRDILAREGIEGADGVLADLGVSSYQLDCAERGFSFHKDAPLDMRMDKRGRSAEDVVNDCSEQELFRIISCYGEERFARNIAKNIVKEREKKRITTTFELSDIVRDSIPAKFRREGGHPARKTFQAIRIEVNGEIEMLPEAVESMFRSLKVGGVLSLITFHSLEDRCVKTLYKSYVSPCSCPPEFPVCVCGRLPEGELPFKAAAPGEEELQNNPRSRSARLRSIIRIR